MDVPQTAHQAVGREHSFLRSAGTGLAAYVGTPGLHLAAGILAALLVLSCDSESGSSECRCKGDRVCVDGVCVDPENVPGDSRALPSDISSPYEDGYSPYEDTSSPDKDTSSPYEDGYSPYEDTSSPYEDGYSPYEDTSSPDKDTSSPYEDIQLQEDSEAPCGWQCNNGECIKSNWVCDGESDCSQGEDEAAGLCGSTGTGGYCDHCDDDSDCMHGMACSSCGCQPSSAR